MKAIIKETEPVFKPVTLEITFETEREIKMFAQWVGSTTYIEIMDKANNSKSADFDVIKNFSSMLDPDNIHYDIYSALSSKIREWEGSK